MNPNELIAALIESDDDKLTVKDLLGDEPAPEQVPPPSPDLLNQAIGRKEKYLGLSCRDVSVFTNRLGETFFFGQFGSQRPRERAVTAVLLYYQPEKGWQLEGLQEAQDEFEIDPKDLDDRSDLEQEPVYLELGSVSCGTMLEEDLIPRFLYALEGVDPAKAEEVRRDYAEEIEQNDPDFYSELFDILQEYCPPYTYFGAHPGDGADFGVWINDDKIEDDLRYEDTVQEMVRGQPMPTGSQYVVVRDLHGDIQALLDGRNGKEIWSV
jgi:hypothetical protein